MYWPLGVASTFSVPRTAQETPSEKEGEAPEEPLISLSRAASSNMLASISATELIIWQTQVYHLHPLQS